MAFMMRFRGISAMHVDLKMPNGCELLKNQDHDHKMPLSLKKKKNLIIHRTLHFSGWPFILKDKSTFLKL